MLREYNLQSAHLVRLDAKIFYNFNDLMKLFHTTSLISLENLDKTEVIFRIYKVEYKQKKNPAGHKSYHDEVLDLSRTINFEKEEMKGLGLPKDKNEVIVLLQQTDEDNFACEQFSNPINSISFVKISQDGYIEGKNVVDYYFEKHKES